MKKINDIDNDYWYNEAYRKKEDLMLRFMLCTWNSKLI